MEGYSVSVIGFSLSLCKLSDRISYFFSISVGYNSFVEVWCFLEKDISPEYAEKLEEEIEKKIKINEGLIEFAKVNSVLKNFNKEFGGILNYLVVIRTDNLVKKILTLYPLVFIRDSFEDVLEPIEGVVDNIPDKFYKSLCVIPLTSGDFQSLKETIKMLKGFSLDIRDYFFNGLVMEKSFLLRLQEFETSLEVLGCKVEDIESKVDQLLGSKQLASEDEKGACLSQKDESCLYSSKIRTYFSGLVGGAIVLIAVVLCLDFLQVKGLDVFSFGETNNSQQNGNQAAQTIVDGGGVIDEVDDDSQGDSEDATGSGSSEDNSLTIEDFINFLKDITINKSVYPDIDKLMTGLTEEGRVNDIYLIAFAALLEYRVRFLDVDLKGCVSGGYDKDGWSAMRPFTLTTICSFKLDAEVENKEFSTKSVRYYLINNSKNPLPKDDNGHSYSIFFNKENLHETLGGGGADKSQNESALYKEYIKSVKESDISSKDFEAGLFELSKMLEKIKE